MLVVAYESSGQPLPQVSEECHSRSSAVLFEAWLIVQLVVAFHRDTPHMIIKQMASLVAIHALQ